MSARIFLCICILALKVHANFLDECKKTKVEENVTLKGGIGAGNFHKLGKVISTDSCIELCCKTKNCHVAFLSGNKCYGVECVSEEECESTNTDTSDVKVYIAHVRPAPKRELVARHPCTANNSLSAIQIQHPLLAGGLPLNNQKPDSGAVPGLGNIPGLKAGTNSFHPMNFQSKQEEVLLNPSAAAKGILGLPAKSPVGQNVQKGLIPASPAGPNMKMAGKCQAGKIYKEVTLKGGIKAGTYKDVGEVKGMEDCQTKCCAFNACDVAFLLGKRCFLVGCADGKSCQPHPAKKSNYHPMASYVVRWSSEGVRHTVHIEGEDKGKFVCPAFKLLPRVTLKGGLKSGDFTDVGKVDNFGDCYNYCCQQQSCNLAFMLGQNCFTVKCYTKDLCSTIKAQPSVFNPQIAYVWNRKPPLKLPPASVVLTGIPKTGVGKAMDTCPEGEVMDRVTLVGGIHAGNFRDHGKMKDIQKCRRVCCEMLKCNVAFMLGENCFSVECSNEALCKTQPAKPSRFYPRISFVRKYGSSDILGNASKTPPSPVLPPSPHNAPPTVTLAPKPTQPKITTAAPLPPKPAQAKPEMALNLAALGGNNKPAIPEPAKPEKTPDLTSQLGQADAGQAMSLNIVNGELKLTPVGGANKKEPEKPQIPEAPKLPEKPKEPVKPDDKINKLDFMGGLQDLTPPEPPKETPSCKAKETKTDVTLKGGKTSGNFTERGDVDNIDKCVDFCCKDKICNLAFMLGKTCFTVACKNKELCEPIKAPPSSYSPQLAVVRPVEEQKKEEPEILCKHKEITNDKALYGGMESGDFVPVDNVKTMPACMAKCCDDTKCDLAYMVQNKCYKVTCYNSDMCRTVPAKQSPGTPTMSFMDKKEKPQDVDLNFEVSPAEETKKPTCRHPKIMDGVTLKGGKRAGNFTDMGKVENIQECIVLCCEKENCDIAYMINNHCYAVRCADGGLCQSTEQNSHKENVVLAYMNRNGEPEKDWVIVYIIVGSLAFAAGLGGIIWAGCICVKRQRLKQKRRLLDDDDDQDELLPKSEFHRSNHHTRYRTPNMGRY